MAVSVSWQVPIAVLATVALLSATVASAQDEDRVQTWTQAAESAHRLANAQTESGYFDRACHSYLRAIDDYGKASDALAVVITNRNSRYYGFDFAQNIYDNAMRAKRGAEAVCGKPDLPHKDPVHNQGSVANYEDQKVALQQTVTLSESQAKDSVRLFEAGDFAGACASSRLAANGFGQVARDMKANPQLEAAFVNSAQLYENAKAAAADRDEFYCKK